MLFFQYLILFYSLKFRDDPVFLYSLLLLTAVPLLCHQDVKGELVLFLVLLEVIPDGEHGFLI